MSYWCTNFPSTLPVILGYGRLPQLSTDWGRWFITQSGLIVQIVLNNSKIFVQSLMYEPQASNGAFFQTTHHG